jgi:2-C-methyl-D-erythritol 4-phosphate cytidylyltransferase
MRAEAADGSSPENRRAGAVLLADGGAAWASSEPRAFARVGARTLLELCAETLDRCDEIEGFVVVVPAGIEGRAAEAARGSPKFLGVVLGGRSRRESVTAGVAALPSRFDVVACHDVARPLASPELFAAVLGALERADAVVPRAPVGDTVKRVEDGVVEATVPRSGLWTLQTPRGFRREALVATYRDGDGKVAKATDELWSLQMAGFRVLTVAGESTNIRVSSPLDLQLVGALLAERRAREDGR